MQLPCVLVVESQTIAGLDFAMIIVPKYTITLLYLHSDITLFSRISILESTKLVRTSHFTNTETSLTK